jgi:YD repeat-containing protein
MRFAADHFRDELAGKVVHAVVAGGIEAPSPVGGVYLGGAGKSLEGLGQLSGVAVDPVTGSVVLLAKDGEFQLPPLRMDDLVTIFRSVYLHGEPPSVTINPRKDNPHGELMDVVHGSATKDSYAGWILFEADRIMKCYTIGQDNETKENVSTSVAGYPEVLQTIFFGGGFGDGNKSGGNWERFWIVPSGVSQFRGTNRTLTLFDVPLKVKTQKMVMKEGRLQDDPHGESSAGAKAFIEWFTRNYEAIAQERSLPPPAGSGLAQPVQVFTELRRVALICAIAEQLRDQGVAMPEWMRDHEVAKVPVTPTTPALTVPKSAPARNGTIHASIYGGVNLAPADDVRKSFDAGSQLADLTPAQRETTKAQVATADALTPVVLRAARENPPLQTFAVQAGDQSYHAVSLPGADSKALMPCRLSEADLVVPVEGGGRIALAREFNSFFRPTDVWGAAWTMAQPRLEKTKVPVKRTDHAVTSKEVPELHVPLEGAAVRFSEIREVPSIHATLAVPDHTCGILGLATAKEPLVAAGELDEVVFKDGHSWYFDRQGQLVGERSAPFTTVYARDSLGTLRKITGYLGTQASATISLEYNLEGRLKSATARSKSGEETVTYGYGPAGLLESVTSSQGQARYAYENGLVKQIAWSARQKGETFAAPKILRQFDYTAQGQLKSETDAQGATVSYRIESQAGELRLAVAPADKARGATTATYDAALRPLELKSADHTQTTWRYLEDGTETATTKYPDGESQTTTMTADGKRRLTERSDQIKTEETFDQARRLTALAVNGKPMFAQQWHPDGLLRSVDFETHSAHHEYDGHGVLVSIMQTPPGAEGRLSKWQRTEFDRDGRPVGVKDFTGEDSKIGYDEGGRIRQIVSKQNGKDYGLTVQRSGDGGRVESIQSSWGDWKYRYAADGSMESARFSQGRDESALEFGGGRLKQVTQFDGGKTAVEYYAGAQEGLVKAVRTPAIALDYQYGAENRLERIGCGKGCSLEYEYDGKGRLCAYRMRPRDLAKETSAAAQTAPQTTSQTAPPTAPQATSPQRSKLMKWLTGEGTKKP